MTRFRRSPKNHLPSTGGLVAAYGYEPDDDLAQDVNAKDDEGEMKVSGDTYSTEDEHDYGDYVNNFR